ncbi:MAG: ergothioneine biosynthesis protein EgtB [Myxococcales bacterium]|nr:ergothioneine biosynthesis protein EgtB [Myxococcales bacterium]
MLWAREARERTLALVAPLDDEQLFGPRLPTVNPLLWELGHVAWFQEHWVLFVAAGLAPARADCDALYDSSAVPHDVRWDLPLPSRAATLAFLASTLERVLARPRPWDERTRYFLRLAVFHEDLHDEAFAITLQTHGYPAPALLADARAASRPDASPRAGDVTHPGGAFLLGATADAPFVFDNEKWAHEVRLRPFAIARSPVTQAEFAAFVHDGGYDARSLWTDDGWRWREATSTRHPVYWHRDGDAWLRREFDQLVPLEPQRPMVHANAHEADAYCRWAKRRLPSEAEWEAAAVADTAATRDLGQADRDFSKSGWEWTASAFLPYPGFVVDPYEDYSRPWFHTHRVLRGSSWLTPARLVRPTFRNFYTPDRCDPFAGFRTCALDEAA